MLTESDFTTETQNPILLSDALWRTRFGADPSVLPAWRAVNTDPVEATRVD